MRIVYSVTSKSTSPVGANVQLHTDKNLLSWTASFNTTVDLQHLYIVITILNVVVYLVVGETGW